MGVKFVGVSPCGLGVGGGVRGAINVIIFNIAIICTMMHKYQFK